MYCAYERACGYRLCLLGYNIVTKHKCIPDLLMIFSRDSKITVAVQNNIVLQVHCNNYVYQSSCALGNAVSESCLSIVFTTTFALYYLLDLLLNNC